MLYFHQAIKKLSNINYFWCYLQRWSLTYINKNARICFWYFGAKLMRSRRLALRTKRLATAAQSLSRLGGPNPINQHGGNALMISIRGFWDEHREHELLIASALQNLGYQVRQTTCPGGAEVCGFDHMEMPHLGYPRHCGECRHYCSIKIDGSTLDRSSSFRYTPTILSDDEVIEISKYGRLRHALGDHTNTANIPEFISSARVFERWFLSKIKESRPAVVVLFNGLFFPEHIFLQICAKMRIPVLCHERGMRKGSLFLSKDSAACHYRADAIWEAWLTQRSGLDLANFALLGRNYLYKRLRGPEDPHGNPRKRSHSKISKFKGQYFVFFPSVAHDTASMGKDGIMGDLYQSAFALCRAAELAKKNLVIRIHPDESNANFPSKLPIKNYLLSRGVNEQYIEFIAPDDEVDSYRLAWNAAGCFVYNGTLGIELPSLGIKVYNLGRSHYCGKDFTEEIKNSDELEKSMLCNKDYRLGHSSRLKAQVYLYYYVYIANLSINNVFSNSEQISSIAMKEFSAVKDRIFYLLSGK